MIFSNQQIVAAPPQCPSLVSFLSGAPVLLDMKLLFASQADHPPRPPAGGRLQPDHVLLSQRPAAQQALRQLRRRGGVSAAAGQSYCKRFNLTSTGS